jgi:hypothetical protein
MSAHFETGHSVKCQVLSLQKWMAYLMKPEMSFKLPLDEREKKSFEIHSTSLKRFSMKLNDI